MVLSCSLQTRRAEKNKFEFSGHENLSCKFKRFFISINERLFMQKNHFLTAVGNLFKLSCLKLHSNDVENLIDFLLTIAMFVQTFKSAYYLFTVFFQKLSKAFLIFLWCGSQTRISRNFNLFCHQYFDFKCRLALFSKRRLTFSSN